MLHLQLIIKKVLFKKIPWTWTCCVGHVKWASPSPVKAWSYLSMSFLFLLQIYILLVAAALAGPGVPVAPPREATSDVVSRKVKKCIEKKEIFLIPGEGPTRQHGRASQVTSHVIFHAENAHFVATSTQTPQLLLRVAPNHCTCKLFVSKWDFRLSHFIFI
jgi:hypothetical protein